MSENFNLEIITPDQTVLKSITNQAIIPAYEGLMTILKDHIPLITFLRPGFVEVKIENEIEKFYIEEGTVEFFENNLLILSANVKNKKNISAEVVNNLLLESKKELENNSINDKEKYILSYKIEALESINR